MWAHWVYDTAHAWFNLLRFIDAHMIWLKKWICFLFSGVKGGPLYDTTRAWFNLLRFIVAHMKNGYLDEGGFIFADLSSDKSDTEDIDDENGASLHERLVTPEKVWF